jgi:hypothetical protein
MAVHIRQNGSWNNITFDITPFAVGGTWFDETSNRLYRDTSKSDIEEAKRIYTNNNGNLMLVRAVPGMFRNTSKNSDLTASDVAGSYAIAYVDDLEVARFRDNGTANSEQVRFEVQFFAPNYSEYYVKVFKSDGSTWQGNDPNGNPRIETLEWYEFKFQ